MLESPAEAPLTAASQSIKGSIDVFLSRRIYGWAFRKDVASPLRLNLEVNGKFAVSFLCNEERKDLPVGLNAPLNCGFSIDPRPYLAAGWSSCRLTIADMPNTQLGASERVFIPHESSVFTPVVRPTHVWGNRTDPSFLLRSTATPNPIVAQIFGLFNTGTNFAHKLFEQNHITYGSLAKMLFKHYPPSVLEQLGSRIEEDQRSRSLLVILARDPYDWIRSMLVSPYGCRFESVTSKFQVSLKTRAFGGPSYEEHLNSALADTHWRKTFQASSIAEYWSVYYRGWMELKQEIFPNAIFVRYEDLVRHPCEMVVLLRAALSRPRPRSVIVPTASAKPGSLGHRSSRDYFGAKKKLQRINTDPGLDAEAIQQISQQLDAGVCSYLGYDIL